MVAGSGWRTFAVLSGTGFRVVVRHVAGAATVHHGRDGVNDERGRNPNGQRAEQPLAALMKQ